MSRQGVLAKFSTVRSIAYSSIMATYATLDAPFLEPLRSFRLINDTDGKIFISVDGQFDYFFLPANSFVLYDVSANSVPNYPLRTQDGLQLYIKYLTAPTTGSFYVESMYAKGE